MNDPTLTHDLSEPVSPRDSDSEGEHSGKNGGRYVVIIPARLQSTRLPRKMLLAETGKPLIQHTYEMAVAARLPSHVCVATDHGEIRQAVERFGGDIHMTDPDAASGTDRVAEVARNLPDVEIVVNVQGDEPELHPQAIDEVIELLLSDREAMMATLAAPITSREVLNDASCVKVVRDAQGGALYFSRSPIPHPRQWSDDLLAADPPHFLLHLGIYAYRREFLLRWSQLPPSPLEQMERLEQLRVLSAGYRIQVGLHASATPGIDTPEDYRAFVRRQRQR